MALKKDNIGGNKMLKIRQNVFETNSSSTHSLILCSDEDYKKLRNEELFIGEDDELTTKEQRNKMINSILAEHPEYDVDDLDVYSWELPKTLNQWIGNEYLEYGEDKFTTKNGEIVHAVYKYGYDG